MSEWENTHEPSCTERGSKNRFCERSLCDYTELEEIATIGHIWNNGTVTKEPSEEETGIRTFTCEACGETRDETIPALDHVYSYTSVVTAPTCEEDGYTTYTCSCGDTYTDNKVSAYAMWKSPCLELPPPVPKQA